MNARHFFSQPKTLAAMALLALTGAANAGGVYWSVGVNAPIQGPGVVQAVVSNGHRHYGPQPVVYYQQPAPIVVQQPRYYGVQPVVYEAPAPRCLPRMAAWHDRWHHHHGGQAYASGYGRGYEQGYERGYRRGDDGDDRRGGGRWDRRD